MAVETSNTQALEDLLKPHRQEVDVLKEALEEVTKEDAEKKKVAAKELVRKAMELQGRMNQAERDFLAQKKKWDKELGKTIRKLQNMVAGRPVNDGIEDDKDSGGGGEEQTES